MHILLNLNQLIKNGEKNEKIHVAAILYRGMDKHPVEKTTVVIVMENIKAQEVAYQTVQHYALLEVQVLKSNLIKNGERL